MLKMLLENIENDCISLEKSEQETLTEMAENSYARNRAIYVRQSHFAITDCLVVSI
jgi:hypothetical protein